MQLWVINVIYIDAKDEIVVAIASSFKPAVHDRITFVQHNILPYIDEIKKRKRKKTEISTEK